MMIQRRAAAELKGEVVRYGDLGCNVGQNVKPAIAWAQRHHVLIITEFDVDRTATLRRGYTVYDLGANVGLYSLLASVLVGKEGKVFSFEPVERNLHYLRRHMALNRATNCTVWNVAIGRSDGTGQFDMGINHVSGHLTAAKHSGTFDVRIVSLDSLVASGQLPPPNLIKCDIEGAEYDALVGASRIITKHRPVIILATHGPFVHEQCCTMLADLNYVIAPLEYYGADRQLLAKPN